MIKILPELDQIFFLILVERCRKDAVKAIAQENQPQKQPHGATGSILIVESKVFARMHLAF
jgi:hypothetical protein